LYADAEMSVDVVLGLQRGDEAKGRVVDRLASEYDYVARFNGANNAGHTIVLSDDRVLALHQLPSGITHTGVKNIIGSGAFVNPVKLVEEIENVKSLGFEVSNRNLLISEEAHLIFPHHIYADHINELGEGRQGSTKMGIAQSASSKVERKNKQMFSIEHEPDEIFSIAFEGLSAQRDDRRRAGLEEINEYDVAQDFAEKAKQVGTYVTDTVVRLNKELRQNPPARILAEGAQAFLLDINHGMYPFVTSSSTTSGAVSDGLGIGPHYIDNVIGVAKAIPSHVGEGPFVTKVTDEDLLSKLHGDMSQIDAEVGTTTGRVRHLGHFDLPQLRRANMVNNTRTLFLSKLDWLSRYGEEIPVCTSYIYDGYHTNIAPSPALALAKSKPLYDYLAGWEDDISTVRNYKDLPKVARRYVEFVEDHLDMHISLIGVGPRRDQVITKSA
jgi:adenylosuccinate synthase